MRDSIGEVHEQPAAPNPFDAYPPAAIARLVETAGVRKANLPLLPTVTLGLLAGAFISFGALFYTVVTTGNTLGFGPGRLLGGLAFSLGLILVIVAGAELFTGNNLIVMAWAEGKVSTRQLLRNWTLVYCANFAGAVATALVVWLSGVLELDGGRVGASALQIAQSKVALAPLPAFFRGILCNALVCLAVWMCFAAHGVTDKVLAIVFPIAGFVALGFEHSIANMYFIPLAMFAGAPGVDLAGLLSNLLPVTLGNIVGGGGGVALVYWIVYLRPARD
ncbi:MAG TPA: formate/nitrite transporter family protein [Candidatus Competibacteraceae bacterium]|nr:formate/nitrite transporter family protein [Candidatus Competibacteraceae bacterium]